MDANLKQNTAQPKSSWLLGLLVMVWLGCALGGLFVVWAYENRPGTPATVESEWPANTAIERATDRPTKS